MSRTVRLAAAAVALFVGVFDAGWAATTDGPWLPVVAAAFVLLILLLAPHLDQLLLRRHARQLAREAGHPSVYNPAEPRTHVWYGLLGGSEHDEWVPDSLLQVRLRELAARFDYVRTSRPASDLPTGPWSRHTGGPDA